MQWSKAHYNMNSKKSNKIPKENKIKNTKN